MSIRGCASEDVHQRMCITRDQFGKISYLSCLLYVVKFAIVLVTQVEHLRVCQLDMLHFTVFCSTSNEIKKTLIGSDE